VGTICTVDSQVDRIRRVLSDGAPPAAPRPQARRLRQVEGLRQVEDVSNSAPALDEALRRRLDALGVGVGTKPVDSSAALAERRPLLSPPPIGPDGSALHLHPPAEDYAWALQPHPGTRDEPRLLAELVGGTLRETPHGSFLQVERRMPLALNHGCVQLQEALSHPVPLRPHEQGPEALERISIRDAVFIDTETTGLSGGTGTVAFLVGAGWVEEDSFVVRQYFMRDYPDEEALLHAFEEDLADRPLVSFNGRSFDWPLLKTRWQMHRRRAGERAHLDLLTAARRLWGRTLHSHSLATLERHVLRLDRSEDLPGYLIPSAWFDFVRSGWGGTIAQAFRHNEIDVVSMVALFARVGAILDEPGGRVEALEDRIGTAKFLLDLGDPQRARHCLEVGLQGAAPAEERGIRRLLGHLCRRSGEWEAALEHWQLVAKSGEFDTEAYEQVAKIQEHRLRDFGAALSWTRAALEQVVEGTKCYEAFAHRAARLERKNAGRRV
jgi:uncharacterized protein YprB with RNaseH-like and TPR domain